MATVSSIQAPKRKKLVYGRAGKSGFGGANFFDDDEDEPSAGHPTISRQSHVTSTYPMQKTEVKATTEQSVNPVKAHAKQHDTFDVPSSDDEEADTRKERHKMSPPKYRPNLFEDTRLRELAPWERKRKAEASAIGQPVNAKRHKTPEGSPDAQLRHELARATQSPEARLSLTSTPKSASPAQRSSPATSPPVDTSHNTATSAFARLAARKRLAESNAASSADEGSTHSIVHTVPKAPIGFKVTPGKRALKTTEASHITDDVVMLDAEGDHKPSDTMNIYDFPQSEDEVPKPKRAAVRSKPSKINERRGKPSTNSRSTPMKGISTPARLAEMIATDSDSTEAPTRSPSISTSRKSTPHQPSTPPSGPLGSPQTAIKATGIVTPKQAKLWNKLLPSDPVAPSPSGLPIEDLRISGGKRFEKSIAAPKLNRSHSDTTRRRTRLVDRLKASAEDSDDDGSDEYDTEDALRDVEIAEQTSSPKTAIPAQAPKLQRQTSQSQGQSQPVGSNAGPKITYSRARTYLAEDNFEADLMLGLDSDSVPLPAVTKRGLSNNSQKSAYELEDSDDDEGAGKIRSIHELRAAGSSVRGMGDIEDLLDDASKHGATQKGTRRSALITLASRLMDKPFKDRFIGQSCEARLAAECGTGADEVADFLITASLVLLLESEPAEHVVLSFRDGQVLEWLANHVDKPLPINRLAKDRRSNMSKASQISLLQFADALKAHSTLWNEHPPMNMTHRAVSLKAIDLLARAFRRLGDRSELLNDRQIHSILPDSIRNLGELDPVDTMLSIAALESLSTTATTLDWPIDVFETLACTLPRLNNLNQLRDTKFLALRLCLNLTNDHLRNCALLAKSNKGLVVPHLVGAVQSGFADLSEVEDGEEKAITLDLLVLAIGIMINLSEHSDEARQSALNDADGLEVLVGVFQIAQKHMLEAESEEESVANVTFGYLAVMLANLCQYGPARDFVAARLPGRNLRLLVAAVMEFVEHHQKVDTLNFEGEEGAEVWSAFTEKLKGVLRRLEEVVAASTT